VAAELMTIAYEAGVNFFDNAEAYAAGEAERVMGRVLKQAGWPRSTWCVSSKVFWGGPQPTCKGLFRKHVVEACHGALERLQVDYLDLFFCHRPDLDTPLVETVAAMTDLVRQGKILYWGTSEWTGRDIALAHAAAARDNLAAPVMEQPQYNLFERTRFEVDYARLYGEVGLGTTVWSPLARGELVGHYLEEKDGAFTVSKAGEGWLKKAGLPQGYQARVEKVAAFAALARDLGLTPPRLALAWVLKNPNVTTAILGASKPAHLQENLKAADDVPCLTDEVLERIEELFQTRPEPEGVFR
jgi:voltage-dependent potassium channel beta subunit